MAGNLWRNSHRLHLFLHGCRSSLQARPFLGRVIWWGPPRVAQLLPPYGGGRSAPLGSPLAALLPAACPGRRSAAGGGVGRRGRQRQGSAGHRLDPVGRAGPGRHHHQQGQGQGQGQQQHGGTDRRGQEQPGRSSRGRVGTTISRASSVPGPAAPVPETGCPKPFGCGLARNPLPITGPRCTKHRLDC